MAHSVCYNKHKYIQESVPAVGMFVAPPEVTSLLQHLQPTIPLFQILEGYRDIQSVEAVLQSQETFALRDNTAHFKKGDGPIDVPDEVNRVRYLGYFLASQLNPNRMFRFQLSFGPTLAHHEFILLLRSFWLTGKRQIQVQQGISLQAEAEVNTKGEISFEFEPLADTLKDPSRIVGFNVFLIRPQTTRKKPPPPPEEPQHHHPPRKPGPFLNVLRKIDTKV